MALIIALVWNLEYIKINDRVEVETHHSRTSHSYVKPPEPPTSLLFIQLINKLHNKPKMGQDERSLLMAKDEDTDESAPCPHPPQSLNRNTARVAETSTADPASKISSLDFERVVNEYSIQATRDRFFVQAEKEGTKAVAYGAILQKQPSYLSRRRNKKHLLGYAGRTATRWALTATVGLMTGLTAIFIVTCSEKVIWWKQHTMNMLASDPGISSNLIFLVFASVNLTLASASSLLCLAWVPEGAGSGIPEVKAYLNGVRVKRFSSLPLFFVKIIGTILSVSSGLAIGMEGPLIHIGAIIGASCTKMSGIICRLLAKARFGHKRPWAQRLWSWTTSDLSHFATDAERRDLISIGASCGFAASFGAPIGGLLFILDDISSYFGKEMFLRMLVDNAIGTFCLALQHGDLSNYSVINLGTFDEPNGNIFLTRFEEIPLYILIGIGGGALGGIFCCSYDFLQSHNRFLLVKNRAKLQFLEVVILSIITSALLFYLPIMAWTCKENEMGGDSTDHADTSPNYQLFCQPGEINELANILLGSRVDAIRCILTDPSQFKPQTLGTVGLVFYCLMTFTFGSSLPSGIFMPTVLIGASLGGAWGLIFQNWFDQEITPSTFALLGVAALLASIQRSTVSLCFILVEGTGQIKVLIPVIITVVIARYISGVFHAKGIYDIAMDWKRYPYLDHAERKNYDVFQVGDIMSEPVVTIGPRERAQRLVTLLRDNAHHGFPVVDPSTQKFLGLVRRDQIVALLECGVFDNEGGEPPAEPSFPDSPSTISSLSWTPPPGASKTPLMHWAYHIKDDRYDYVLDTKSLPVLEDNDFDEHEWLLSIRANMQSFPMANPTVDDQCHRVIGDDSLPPLPSNILKTGRPIPLKHRSTSEPQLHGLNNRSTPTGFAAVGLNKSGNVVISWLNQDYRSRWVNVSAVMNTGTYCLVEFCPISKAHSLFTSLGLRHIVVLGGRSGGSVVGVLTRANLLQSFVEERTKAKQ